MLFRRNLRTFLIASALLASCGGSVRSTETDSSTLASRIAAKCSQVEKPELGSGTVCFDNGFRVASDDFSFTNWGRSPNADANVTVQTFIDLFGHSAVCLPGPDTSCEMRPSTIQQLEQWNNALSGGRCEGIATLSSRLFLKYDRPEDFSPTALRAADLKITDGRLSQDIVKWWATQFLTEVRDRAAESRTKSPLQLVDDLLQGLSHNVGYTLGLYYGSSGHSVTPFAVTKRNDTFVIHVYDNNNPGERREVLVNSTNNSWLFPHAFTAIDGTPIDWDGTTGTLELVPISSRMGPFSCPFCNGISSNDRVLTIASRDPLSPGYVSLRTRSGKTLNVTPSQVTNNISGATFELGKGATSGTSTITLPAAVGDFDVFVRRANADVPAGDVVLNLRQAGAATIQVSGNLAETAINSKTAMTAMTAILAVRNSDTTVHAPSNSNARVSVAAGTNLSRTDLAARTSLVVHAIASDSIEVSLKGVSNDEIATAHFAAHSATHVIEAQWALDPKQQFTATSEQLSAVSVRKSPSVSFTPRKAPQTTSTTFVPSSIVISSPD